MPADSLKILGSHLTLPVFIFILSFPHAAEGQLPRGHDTNIFAGLTDCLKNLPSCISKSSPPVVLKGPPPPPMGNTNASKHPTKAISPPTSASNSTHPTPPASTSSKTGGTSREPPTTTMTTPPTSSALGSDGPSSIVASTQPLGSPVSASSLTTSAITTQSASHTSGTSSRATLIGGVIGGLVLLALFVGFGFLYLRHRRTRQPHAGTLQRSIDDPGKLMPRNNLRSFFHNHSVVNTTTDPMIIEEDYRQPEGKRERFLRVQQEMDDAQRQCELLRSSLSTRSRRNAINEGLWHDLEGREIEERLRQELECMNNKITELEAQLMEVVEPPPDYTSSNRVYI